jgi:hypothetical protein
MIGVKLSDRVRNEVIREECVVKEDVVTKIEEYVEMVRSCRKDG